MPSAARALMIGATLWAPFSDSRVDGSSTDAERWRTVAKRAVYFGHQSVGDNIAAGIERLNSDLKLGLRLVQTHEPSAVSHPAFVHFHAGRNQDPSSKNAAIVRMLESRPRPDQAIVLLKYCYVDIDHDRDVEAMFSAYQATVRNIRARFPDVTIVHSTVPVTTVETAMKAQAKQLLGKPSVRQAAITRQRYNALVRAAFAGREPLFDIARIESTGPNHERVFFDAKGQKIETLAPEYTSDGGHLNERGQALVAKELLNVLARITEKGG